MVLKEGLQLLVLLEAEFQSFQRSLSYPFSTTSIVLSVNTGKHGSVKQIIAILHTAVQLKTVMHSMAEWPYLHNITGYYRTFLHEIKLIIYSLMQLY